MIRMNHTTTQEGTEITEIFRMIPGCKDSHEGNYYPDKQLFFDCYAKRNFPCESVYDAVELASLPLRDRF